MLGSVANLIVVQLARAHGVTIGFWEYFRVGAPLTLVTIASACGGSERERDVHAANFYYYVEIFGNGNVDKAEFGWYRWPANATLPRRPTKRWAIELMSRQR